MITERIDLLENCMGNLCENIGKIARKNARLRDTSDEMVLILSEYSGKEKINTTSKKGLLNFSSFLSAVEDYRNAMVCYTPNKKAARNDVCRTSFEQHMYINR